MESERSFMITPENKKSDSSTSTDKHTPYRKRTETPRLDSLLLNLSSVKKQKKPKKKEQQQRQQQQQQQPKSGKVARSSPSRAATQSSPPKASSAPAPAQSDRLRAELRIAASTNSDLQQKLLEMSSAATDASRKQVQAEQQVRQLEGELREARSGYEESKRAIYEEVEELKRELNELVGKMEKDNRKQGKALAKKERRIAILEENLEEMTGAMEYADQQVNILTNQLSHSKSHVATLTAKVESLQSQQLMYGSGYQQQQQNQFNVSQLSASIQEVQRLTGEMNGLKNSLAQVRQQLAEATSKDSAQQAHIQQQQSVIGDLNGRVSELQSQKMDLNATLSTLRHEHRETTNTLRVTVTKCEDLRSEKHHLKLELSTAKSKLNDVVTKASMIAEREKIQSGELSGLKERERTLKKEITGLEAAAKEKEREVSLVESKLKACAGEVAELAEACEKLEKAAKKLEKDLAEVKEELEKEKIDKDRIICLRNEENRRFGEAMGYFKQNLREISESQHQQAVVSNAFGLESHELRQQIAWLQQEKASMRDKMEGLEHDAEELRRNPMSPVIIERRNGYRTPPKNSGFAMGSVLDTPPSASKVIGHLEQTVAKLQQKLTRQAQYSFARFNALRAEYQWGQRLYQNARANVKEGVQTMEWPPSQHCKDLAGFGYDEMYEEFRNEGAMSGSADDDDGHNSQDTSGVWSNEGSVASGAGSTKSGSNRGFMASRPPHGKKRRLVNSWSKEPSPRNRDEDPSQGY